MPGPQVRVEGARELRKTLRKAGVDVADLKRANAEAAAYVATASFGSARHKSGRMAGASKGNRAVGRAVVSNRLIYAPIQHWGWAGHGISADPWLSETAQRTEPTWLNFFMANLEQILDQIQGA